MSSAIGPNASRVPGAPSNSPQPRVSASSQRPSTTMGYMLSSISTESSTIMPPLSAPQKVIQPS